MDKDKFWRFVESLRHGIVNCTTSYNHEALDGIIKTVTGGQAMNAEESIQDDVKKVIKKLKALKEDEVMQKKAEKWIEEIKKEL